MKAKPTQRTKDRRLKDGHYRSLRLSKRIKYGTKKLPSAYSLLKKTLGLLKSNSWLFTKLIILYGVLTLILVRGLGNSLQLQAIKTNLQDGTGFSSKIKVGTDIFSYLIGNGSGGQTEVSGLYQGILLIVFSLAILWLVRHLVAGKKVKLKPAFYQGMYPLVPFMLVLFVMGLQLLPLLLGSWLYSTVVGNGIVLTWLEHVLWGLLYAVLALLSLYMMCSSLFALYIVTLNDMTPLKALRTARQLVLHRRLVVGRKILFLPLVLLIIGGIIMVPIIMLVTPAAEWVFLFLALLILPLVHTYVYMLYRELI